jgi:hypothetical protein
VNQAIQHLANVLDFVLERGQHVVSKIAKFMGNQSVRLKFHQRTPGNEQELNVLPCGTSPPAFRDIGRDRRCRSSDLADQSKLLGFRKPARNPIDTN